MYPLSCFKIEEFHTESYICYLTFSFCPLQNGKKPLEKMVSSRRNVTYIGDLEANVHIEKSKAISSQYLFDQNSYLKRINAPPSR
jgi:hypothetical protein